MHPLISVHFHARWKCSSPLLELVWVLEFITYNSTHHQVCNNYCYLLLLWGNAVQTLQISLCLNCITNVTASLRVFSCDHLECCYSLPPLQRWTPFPLHSGLESFCCQSLTTSLVRTHFPFTTWSELIDLAQNKYRMYQGLSESTALKEAVQFFVLFSAL